MYITDDYHDELKYEKAHTRYYMRLFIIMFACLLSLVGILLGLVFMLT